MRRWTVHRPAGGTGGGEAAAHLPSIRGGSCCGGGGGGRGRGGRLRCGGSVVVVERVWWGYPVRSHLWLEAVSAWLVCPGRVAHPREAVRASSWRTGWRELQTRLTKRGGAPPCPSAPKPRGRGACIDFMPLVYHTAPPAAQDATVPVAGPVSPRTRCVPAVQAGPRPHRVHLIGLRLTHRSACQEHHHSGGTEERHGWNDGGERGLLLPARGEVRIVTRLCESGFKGVRHKMCVRAPRIGARLSQGPGCNFLYSLGGPTARIPGKTRVRTAWNILCNTPIPPIQPRHPPKVRTSKSSSVASASRLRAACRPALGVGARSRAFCAAEVGRASPRPQDRTDPLESPAGTRHHGRQ